MDEYREEVERLARERTGEAFYNSTIDHAAVIIEKIFRHAKNEICIVTSHLNARVFGRDEVVEEADAFLSNGNHRVRIVMEEDASALSEGHPFVRILRNHPGGYELRKLPDSLSEAVKYHFTLADDDSYRYEPNKAKWEAVASFGDKEGAASMKSVFDVIWKSSSEVLLPASA